MPADPVEQPRQPARFIGRYRTRHVLRLVPVTVRGNDEALRDLVGDLRPVVPPHEVHQHVEARCRARGRQHLILVDVQRVRLDTNPRIALRQQLRVSPMRRHALAVEHACCGQHENTGADGAEARTALVRSTNVLEQVLRRQLVRVAPAGDDDRIGTIQHLERIRRGDRDAARRAQRPALRGATSKSYQRTPSSGRDSANSSTTQPNSNVQSRS